MNPECGQTTNKSSQVGASSRGKSLALVIFGLVVGIVGCSLVAGVSYYAGRESQNKGGVETGEFNWDDVQHDPSKVVRRNAPWQCSSSLNGTPAAHIVGSKPPFAHPSSPINVTSPWRQGSRIIPINLSWTCTGSHAILKGGMVVDSHGYLTVPKAGVYYIYSQLLIIDQRSNRLVPLGSSTLKSTKNGWRVLMKTSVPLGILHGGSGNEMSEASTYHGGLFQLDANDKIGVQLNNFQRFVPEQTVKLVNVNSYFGAFLVDSYN